MSTVASAKASYAALRRHRGPDAPEVAEAEKELRTAKVAAYIRRLVDAAPPLSPEQRATLAALLRGGGRP